MTPDLFSDPRRSIASAIISAWDRVGACDFITVLEELSRTGGGIEAEQEVGRLIEAVPTDAQVLTHVRLLRERTPGRETVVRRGNRKGGRGIGILSDERSVQNHLLLGRRIDQEKTPNSLNR